MSLLRSAAVQSKLYLTRVRSPVLGQIGHDGTWCVAAVGRVGTSQVSEKDCQLCSR